jgi:predicted component of type VI protein secretion system
MVQNATAQKNKESQTFSQKINPFKKTKSDTLSFEDAVEYLMSKITKEAIEQDANIISGIEQEISKLDDQIIKKSGVSNLTEGAISKTLVTSGSLFVSHRKAR